MNFINNNNTVRLSKIKRYNFSTSFIPAAAALHTTNNNNNNKKNNIHTINTATHSTSFFDVSTSSMQQQNRRRGRMSSKTNAAASGAIVRGQFSSYNFIGNEGNQGPYKIFGPNNEPNFVIIAGSEKVFVNGSAITKGVNDDYLIDYNIGEIRFNTTFPITNDMRIRVEFQYSNRNYNRFVSYEKAEYIDDKIELSGYFHNENDVKNQPIQSNLTDIQKGILANAGNNTDTNVDADNSRNIFESGTPTVAFNTTSTPVQNPQPSSTPRPVSPSPSASVVAQQKFLHQRRSEVTKQLHAYQSCHVKFTTSNDYHHYESELSNFINEYGML